MQLSLDLLRISVLCQLLPRFVNEEEEAVLLRILHLKLLSTELTHILCGDIGPHEEGLPCAATVDLLEGNSEVILQVETETSGARAEANARLNLRATSRLLFVPMSSQTTQIAKEDWNPDSGGNYGVD